MTSKTVLITGASKRVGAAIARDLHERGMNVVIHYHHSKSEAEALAEELNLVREDSALCLWANLLEPQHYDTLIDQAYAFKQRLDVLINNASSFFPSPIDELSIEHWQDLVGVNMQAPLFLSQKAAGYLSASEGCIINMADIHAYRPLKHHTIYSAAKAGLLMLTKSLALELGPSIRVNAISPGAILWHEGSDEESQAAIVERSVLKRTGKVGDITAAVHYLIADSDYMTGQVLTIDGGRTLLS